MIFLGFFNKIFGGIFGNKDKPILVDKSRRVLFILKRRQNYDEQDKGVQHHAKSLVTGMYNSVSFISDMLNKEGIKSEVVIVIDNNSIDREVTRFKATDVFVEGMWVVSEKFDILTKLHPNVNWVVRCHSEIPFLAGEGNAIERAFGYVKRGVALSSNSHRIGNTLNSVIGDVLFYTEESKKKMLPVLPNYYPVDPVADRFYNNFSETLNIGCFGAVRPLKNQLIQAMAAIQLAKDLKKNLDFHINIGRVESNATSQLKNIRSLFNNAGDRFNLVEHGWVEHGDFCKLLGNMDLSMQVSFSETFNIVTADAVVMNTPVVVSPEISWVYPDCWANPTNINDIVDVSKKVLKNNKLKKLNIERLKEHSESTKKTWMEYFKV